MYFFTDSSEQFCEEDTYYCFSGQKAESQRGSLICPKVTQLFKCHDKNLNLGLCDIKGCALNPAF